ncbi:MAG: O-antigen ligase family protein [Parcubacteria group bacterium]|nr:O-antigen ligase family protein [Parcubacteria group bacterium]
MLEKRLTTIIRWGIYALLFVPLIVSPETIFPFHFGRVLVIQSIIGILLGFWLVLIYLYPKYRPQKTPLLFILIIYFGILLIASLFGVDFDRSFWGNEERMGGLFTLLHFFFLFLISRSVFTNWKDWKKVFTTSVFVGVVVCVVALLQRQGYINLWGIGAGDGRIAGTLGNSIFLAAYLLFNIFLAFLLSIKESKLKYKIILALTGFLSIFTLFVTETRGALVAFVCSLLLVFVGYIFYSKKKIIKILLVAGISFVFIFSFIIFLNKDKAWVYQTPGINRLASTVVELSEGAGTSQTRFLTWGIAIDAWKENPILGWGLDNFNIAFNKYYNPELLRHSVYETWFDRAHNTLFDHLVMSGVLGLASYLLIFIIGFLTLYKFFRQKIIDKHIFIFTTAIVTAYFVQNLFAFSTPNSFLMFFLCLSFIDSFRERKQEDAIKTDRIPYILFLIPIVAVLFNFQVYRASIQGTEGTKLQGAPLEVRIPEFKTALEMWTPYKEETRSDLMSIVLADFIHQTVPALKIEEYFKEAELIALSNIEEHPDYAFYYYILARLYGEMGVYDSGYFIESEKMFARALELSPKRQQIYYGLGKLYLIQGKWDKAITALNTMVELDPEAQDSHWFLAIALLTIGEETGNIDYIKAGNTELTRAYKNGYSPKTADDVRILSSALLDAEEYDLMIRIYESIIKRETTDESIVPYADFCAQVAVIYKERGEKEKAREAALRAAMLDPGFAEEAEMFIKLLE